MNLSNLAREARSALQICSGTTITHQQTLELLAAALGYGSYAALTNRSLVLVDANLQDPPASVDIDLVQERAKDILGQEIPCHLVVDIMLQHRVHVLTLLTEDDVNHDCAPAYAPAHALQQIARLVPLIETPHGEAYEVVANLVKQVRRIACRKFIPTLLVKLSKLLSISLQEPETYLDLGKFERRNEAYRLYLCGAELNDEQLQIAESEAYERWRKGTSIDLLLDAGALGKDEHLDELSFWITNEDLGVDIRYITNHRLLAPLLDDSIYLDDAVRSWLAVSKNNGIKHQLVSSNYHRDPLYKATVNAYFSHLCEAETRSNDTCRNAQRYYKFLLQTCETEEQASYLIPDWKNHGGSHSLRALTLGLDAQARLDAKRVFEVRNALHRA